MRTRANLVGRMCASGSVMRFSRVPVALASLLGLVIALCLPQQAGAAVAAGAAVQTGQASPAGPVGPAGRLRQSAEQ